VTHANPQARRGLNYHEGIEELEMAFEELNEPGTLVCRGCIIDTALDAAVRDEAAGGTCSFCGASAECVTFEDLGNVIDEAVDSFYVSIEESGAFRDDGEWNVPCQDIQDILEYEILYGAVDDSVLLSLVRFAAERNAVPYGYVLRRHVLASLYDWDEGAWRNFMKQARADDLVPGLFEQLPAKYLDLFTRIERVAQIEGLFKTATPTPQLWRCRRGSSEEPRRTASELGSAPAQYAGVGRLNSKGQSVFYGSTTLRGAVIEVANHLGADVELWGGRFTTSRDLYHLDVMDLPDRPSHFAPGAADTFDAIAFLIRFAETLRQHKPEVIGRHYMPTQLFAQFLLRAPEDLRPDAVRFASSVDPTSENWVVFVDHEHCVDEGEVGMDSDELKLSLDLASVQHVRAREMTAVVADQ
jgi:hypothetical protein